MNSRLARNHNVLLFLRTQLSRNVSVIIQTSLSTFIPCGHNLNGRHVQLIGCAVILRTKPAFINTLSIDRTQYQGAQLQHCNPKLHYQNTDSLWRQAIHFSTGKRCKTKSSSTITCTTTAEDITRNTDMSIYEVCHDKDKKCFFVRLPEDTSNQWEVLAKLEYELVRPDLVELYHTEVPPEFQGKGIAKVLAKAAFDAFCEQGIFIRPTCTYLQKYLRENQIPLYMNHLEKGFVL